MLSQVTCTRPAITKLPLRSCGVWWRMRSCALAWAWRRAARWALHCAACIEDGHVPAQGQAQGYSRQTLHGMVSRFLSRVVRVL